MERCFTCQAASPHSPDDLKRHHQVVAEGYKMAAIQARGDCARWRTEHQFQMSQDRDYSKGKPSAETMRCKGAIDALTQFAGRMDQKAREAMERAGICELETE